MPQSLEHVRVGIRRRVAEQPAEIGIRVDSVAADEESGTLEQSLIGRIASDRGNERQLLQNLGKGNRGCRRLIGENPR